FASLLHVNGRASTQLPPFPTRRSSDLVEAGAAIAAFHLGDAQQGIEGGQQAVGLLQQLADRLCLGGLHLALQLRQMVAQSRQRRSEEHTSELQSRFELVCRPLLAQKKR